MLRFKPNRACRPEAKRSAQVHKLFQAKLFKVARAMAHAKAMDSRWAGSLTQAKAHSCKPNKTAMLTTVPEAPTVAKRK